jgi:osmotically-inducible protein OsmY
MTNEELERAVTDELFSDPKIDSEAVAVVADDGTVTLRGTVGSLRQKREARRAAERVYGVTGIINDLEVRILIEHRREDAELRGEVLQALMFDAQVPATIEATVKNGAVTLTGTADWQYQRDEAVLVAGNIPGVTEVENRVTLAVPTPSPADVEDSIADALQPDALLDANNVAVTSANGVVTLTGNVRSWSERDAAVAAAWAAPGVTDVRDRLTVNY